MLETIPEEIFLSILDCLSDGSRRQLLPFVTVSRRWQYTIERQIFERLAVKNTELSAIEKIFRETEAHRRSLVKKIHLSILNLPKYEDDDCHRYEKPNNEIFTDAIFRLFHILEPFNDDERVTKAGGLELKLHEVSSKSDKFNQGKAPKIWSKFIRLVEPEKLPTLSCVSRFNAGHIFPSRRPDPASMLPAASKFGDLKSCRIELNNDPRCFDKEGQKQFDALAVFTDFANALAVYTHSMGSLEISSKVTAPFDEARRPPSLVPLDSPTDSLNVALNDFIQRAHVSSISVSPMHVLGPEFFWPLHNPIPTPASPYWSNLKKIVMFFSPATPNGDWYFAVDPRIASLSEFSGPTAATDEDEDDKSLRNSQTDDKNNTNRFRSVPNPGKLNALLIAMAHAVYFAPSLQEIRLCTPMTPMEPKNVDLEKNEMGGLVRRFNIYYYARGMVDWYGEILLHSSRMICDVGEWRMDEKVESQWKKALGPDGEIIYQ